MEGCDMKYQGANEAESAAGSPFPWMTINSGFPYLFFNISSSDSLSTLEHFNFHLECDFEEFEMRENAQTLWHRIRKEMKS